MKQKVLVSGIYGSSRDSYYLEIFKNHDVYQHLFDHAIFFGFSWEPGTALIEANIEGDDSSPKCIQGERHPLVDLNALYKNNDGQLEEYFKNTVYTLSQQSDVSWAPVWDSAAELRERCLKWNKDAEYNQENQIQTEHEGNIFVAELVNALIDDSKPNRINVERALTKFKINEVCQNILKGFDSLFIPPSGMGNLPNFIVDSKYIDGKLDKEDLFYHPKVNLDANPLNKQKLLTKTNFKNSVKPKNIVSDLINTLLDFGLLQAALEQKKPIYGSCQGAHIGWLLAGHKMSKWDRYLGTFDKNPKFSEVYKQKYAQVMTSFNVPEKDRELNENFCDFGPVTSTKINCALIKTAQGFPENLQKLHQLGETTLATDYQHATMMKISKKIDTIDTGVNVLSMHPVSLMFDNDQPKPTEIMDQQLFDVGRKAVEAFQYKTLIATQSHPFKHMSKNNAEEKNAFYFFCHALGITPPNWE